MPKRVIQLVFLRPQIEDLDGDLFKIKTEDGLVKIISTKDDQGVVRIIPADKIQVIQFGYEKSEPAPSEEPTNIPRPIQGS